MTSPLELSLKSKLENEGPAPVYQKELEKELEEEHNTLEEAVRKLFEENKQTVCKLELLNVNGFKEGRSTFIITVTSTKEIPLIIEGPSKPGAQTQFSVLTFPKDIWKRINVMKAALGLDKEIAFPFQVDDLFDGLFTHLRSNENNQ